MEISSPPQVTGPGPSLGPTANGVKKVHFATVNFTAEERRAFRRQSASGVADWACRNLIVQDGLFRGGPLRLDVSPYLRQPMDSYSDPLVDQVGACGALQVGKTLFLYACLGYSLACRNGNRLLAMPTGKALEKVVDLKLAPLISGSPSLKRRLSGKIKRSGAALRDGTRLVFASAETPSDRASITVQDLFLDEEDLYMPGAVPSDPVGDFIGRTTSYSWWRKIARACRPKGENSSIFHWITAEAGQLFCYEAKCPACNEYQLPNVDIVILASPCDNPETIRQKRLARYRCACGYQWSDHIRDLAVNEGRWRPYKYSQERGFEPAERVAGAKSHGYHMPGILSRFVSLSDIAAARLKAERSDSPQDKESYFNNVLGLPYAHAEVLPDVQVVESRRVEWLPQRVVPHGAVALTCGIDMQKHGFWYLVKAWMPDLSGYYIDNGWLRDWADVYELTQHAAYPVQAPGFPGRPGELLPPERDPVSGQLLPARIHPETGEYLPFWRCGLDTGGTETEGDLTRTEEAYNWIREFGNSVVWATKGASHKQIVSVRESVLDKMPHSKKAIPGGLSLFLLDTHRLKTLALRRLMDQEAKAPTGLYSLAPEEQTLAAQLKTDGRRDYKSLAEQLTAEKLVREKGKMIWKKTKTHNHYLDCAMINEALADAAWSPSLPIYLLQQRRAAELAAQTPPVPPRNRNNPDRGQGEYPRSRQSRFER